MPADETREEGRQPSHPTVRLAPDAAIAARRKYLFEGVEPGREVPAPILRSWERSFALGLNMASRPGLDLLSQQKLREAQQRNEILVRAARGEMEALCRDASIAVVVLTDPHGLVLCRLGEGEFAEKAASVALQPGAVWEEKAAGTNAIGAALAERQSISVIGGEHFFEAHSILSCSAAPIFDPYGAIAGVLDLTNASNEPQALTMALVNRAAEQIERALFDAQFRNCEQMHFHSDPYLIGSPHEGSLAFEGDRLVGANRNGISLLGLRLAGARRPQLRRAVHLRARRHQPQSVVGRLHRSDEERRGLLRAPAAAASRASQLVARPTGRRRAAQGSDPDADHRSDSWLGRTPA